MNYKQKLVKYYSQYRNSKIEDFFKYIYQSSFGPHHLCRKKEEIKNNILDELKETSNCKIITELENGYCRVDLKILNNGLDIDKFIKLVKKSSKRIDKKKSLSILEEMLVQFRELVLDKIIIFNIEELDEKIKMWKESGYAPVHHSEIFKEEYKPSYRIIKEKFLDQIKDFTNGEYEDIPKKKRGDRKDAYLVRDIDPMHFIVPLLYPNRCDNEAFISEKIDLTNMLIYLENKNKTNLGPKYSMFEVILTTLLKITFIRPRMNRFIANKNIYQRYEHSAAFVVKKSLSDDGEESLAYIRASKFDNIDSIHLEVQRQTAECRSDKLDKSSEEMDIFNKMPRWFSKFLVNIITKLDIRGKVPQSLIETDPYYSSVVLSHLGSIRLHAGYHHLTNWGTNSMFCAIGEKKARPFYKDDGTFEMKESLDIGLTIDERIADGYYYSKTIRLIRKLLENPDLLERPLYEEV